MHLTQQAHTVSILAALFACVVLPLSWSVWRRCGGRWPFPSRQAAPVRFVENWTSGRSLKSWLTRMGGANNCLAVTVTDDELWVHPHFPFDAYACWLDLEHRVPLRLLTDVRRRGRRVAVEYVSAEGELRTIELRMRKPDAFVAALLRAEPTD